MRKNTETVVYIVDDDEKMRKFLRGLLETVNLTSMLFASATEFLNDYQADQPGCLLLDVRLPEMSGLELQAELSARSIELSIIFMTGYADLPTAIGAMKAGAVDFVEKPISNQALLDRIQAVLKQSRKAFLDQTKRREILQRLGSLSQRERQVLDRIVDGVPNKLTAYELGISERTVESHRAHVFEKMQMKTSVNLMRCLALVDAITDSATVDG